MKEKEVTNLAQPNSDAPQQNEPAPLHSAVTNFARFYALFNLLTYKGDRETLKREIVSQYTQGRTESLKEMAVTEYEDCCEALDHLTGQYVARKKKRSLCLKLMQEIGIHTGDWARVDNFCLHPRVAGKLFSRLSLAELGNLELKLRSIKRKGGLKATTAGDKDSQEPRPVKYYTILLKDRRCREDGECDA